MERGALSLLTEYGNDNGDSDNEVPIGRVSTKRCLDNIEEAVSISKRLTINKLPVPQSLGLTAQNIADVPTDDPSMHGGKLRCFPHERGNWATYIYVPYDPSDISVPELVAIVTKNSPYLNLQPINHFHMSLTKTVVLKHHWINSFMQSVREKVKHIKRFVTVFGSLNVYCNEERTRTFIGVQIQSGLDTLLRLVEQVDSCLNEFRLPKFYKDPSFHISLVWCVGDHEEEIKNTLPKLNVEIEEFLQQYPESTWYNYVTHLECKCGNKLFKFDLE